jgi:hypothetical protein
MRPESIFDSPATAPFTLGAVMPSRFERYVRIFEPGFSDELGDYVTWSKIAANNSKCAHSLMQWEGITGATDIDPADVPGLGRVHPNLPGHTSEDVFSSLLSSVFKDLLHSPVCACIWEGWANVTAPAGGTEFHYRNRTYNRYSVELSCIGEFSEEYGPVSIVWPADESWCIYHDIDTIDTFIGGSRSVVEAIKAIPELETSDASATQSFDVTSDQINIKSP